MRARNVVTVSMIVSMVLAVGCSVGPSFKTPQVAVADKWRLAADPRVAAGAAADARWWQAFNDPTLSNLVELAYHQNLQLQVAGLRIVESRAQLAVATGQQFPQVQLAFANAAAIGLSKNVPSFAIIDRHYAQYAVGFDAAWEIDFWGKYRRGVESETAALLSSVADYYAGIVSLTAEVARTYVVIRTFEVLIAQAEQNAKVQEDALAIANARFKAGATSELDPTQATTLLESTRATIPQLKIGLEQAHNALATLLGQPTGTVEALLTGPKQIPNAPEKVAVGMPAEILRRRPDIRSAELQAAAQCARIGVAKAELYPSFSILGTVGLSASNANGKAKTLFTADALNYSVGPSISWPFLNYGRLTNGVRVQDARFQELLVNYRDTVLKAAQEVEDGMVGFLNAQEQTTFEQRAVTSAGRAVELSIIQYREGATDYQRVLDAQRSLLQEQNSLAQARSSVVTNLIAVYKALGGGWESRAGQPVVPQQTQAEMQDRTNWGDMLSEPRKPETQEASARPTPSGTPTQTGKP
jgi:NodT family efflux transporter outer membrane factor (OMF) lipoprotein